MKGVIVKVIIVDFGCESLRDGRRRDVTPEPVPPVRECVRRMVESDGDVQMG